MKFSDFTIFFSLSIASYIGAFIRVGIGYYKVWSVDVNYVSCALMGKDMDGAL